MSRAWFVAREQMSHREGQAVAAGGDPGEGLEGTRDRRPGKATSHALPPSCLCCLQQVSFGRGIAFDAEPAGDAVVGARPTEEWARLRTRQALRTEPSTGGCRCTTRASRPTQGGVARAGTGQPRCGSEECSRRRTEVQGGEVEVRRRRRVRRDRWCHRRSTPATGGCSCTTIPKSRPERGGVVGLGSGQLRGGVRAVGEGKHGGGARAAGVKEGGEAGAGRVAGQGSVGTGGGT